MQSHLKIDAKQRERFKSLFARYRMLRETPLECRPMIIIRTPQPPTDMERQLADPLAMLETQLESLAPHLEMEDDHVPSVRINFGTAQIAAAFGCEMYVPKDSLPAAGSHILAKAKDVRNLAKPRIDAGWYGKLAEWNRIWLEKLPEGIAIQHPDIQSPFNSAHLIRGNDIFTDLYDFPEEVDALLKLVTDFMIDVVRLHQSMNGEDGKWFCDWGSLWQGAARMSNCSMQMISPEDYTAHVLKHDIRFLKAIGGGRIHYCGKSREVIDEFGKIPMLSGLDADMQLHNYFELCETLPPSIVLAPTGAPSKETINRLLSGDWPRKRNIIIAAEAPDVESGKKLLKDLRNSIPY